MNVVAADVSRRQFLPWELARVGSAEARRGLALRGAKKIARADVRDYQGLYKTTRRQGLGRRVNGERKTQAPTGGGV